MTRWVRALAAAAAAFVALAVAVPPGRTAGAGVWTEVQGPNLLHPGSEISAVRGIDGSLFVAFSDSDATADLDLAVSKGEHERGAALHERRDRRVVDAAGDRARP